jgi:hypothetical protein
MAIKPQREGSGVLFRNRGKEDDRHPDYVGALTVGGVEYQLSAWVKQGREQKFMSLSVKPERRLNNNPEPTHELDDLHRSERSA